MRTSFYRLPSEQSLVDTVNHAVTAGTYYPAATGLAASVFKDFSLTGKLIAGAGDNSVTITVEGTNDEDTGAADWIQCYAYSTYGDAIINVITNAPSTTTLIGWDFDNWNYRYFRLKVVVTNTGALSNTVIVKLRRKSI
jgi:hypothetical protein